MRQAFSKFIPQNFNDLLCLVLMLAILGMWYLDSYGLSGFKMNEAIQGASIAFFTLIGQYYYRKAKSE